MACIPKCEFCWDDEDHKSLPSEYGCGGVENEETEENYQHNLPVKLFLRDLEANVENSKIFNDDTSFDAIQPSDLKSYENWKFNTAICCYCNTIVAHSQLLICGYMHCSNAFVQRVSFESPKDFFKTVKVFCGMCAIRGKHQHHISSLKPALNTAIELASKEVGTTLKTEFSKIQLLDCDDPLDYTIANSIKKDSLPKIPVRRYIITSKNAKQWNERVAELNEFKNMVIQARNDTRKFLSEFAAKTLEAYMTLVNKTRHLDNSSKTVSLPPSSIGEAKNEIRNREYGASFPQKESGEIRDVRSDANENEEVSNTLNRSEDNDYWF